MFARGSAGIIALPFIIFLGFAYFSCWLLALFFFFVFCLMLVFFRDPDRKTGRGIVSAADGVVDYIRDNNEWLLISVFMNVHNVHVNRAPLKGRVLSVKKRKGGRWPAFSERSSRNAKAMMVFQTSIGKVRVEQITGIFAWRVCPYVKKGRVVRKGSRIGIIRFGSRVNVWLPVKRVSISIQEGEKVLAGVTTIAEVTDEVVG